MTYRLIFAPSFEDDLQAKIDWLREEHVSEPTIQAWLVKVFHQLTGLETYPRLHPVDEKYTTEVGRESRKINFQQYLMIYQVDEAQHEIHLVAFIDGRTRR